MVTFVDRQDAFIQDVIRSLDAESKAVLALVYMRNGKLESPITFGLPEREAVERLGGTLGGCVNSLKSLRGTMVQLMLESGASYWKFKHPTIGDAVAALLSVNAEMIGIYIKGTPIEKLVQQVTCGKVGLEKAIIVPASLFGLVIDRIEAAYAARYKTEEMSFWDVRARVETFLSYRCTKEFLGMLLQRQPKLLDRVSDPGLYLNAVSEVDLAVRLNEVDLLPEEYRRRFVEKIVGYALDGEDLYGIGDSRIQSVFTAAEREEFKNKLRGVLVPNLHEVRDRWESDRGSESPDVHMQPYLNSLGPLRDLFANEADIANAVANEIQETKEWIEFQLGDYGEDNPPQRRFGEVSAGPAIWASGRNIFDDIDE